MKKNDALVAPRDNDLWKGRPTMGSLVSLALVLLLVLPVAGVLLHLYLYRHQALVVPRHEPRSAREQEQRLQQALHLS
jgi:uncharacterized iron-regulated membrane protein